MSKLAGFILEKRQVLLVIAVLLAVVNIYLMGLVTINTDMTVYLPDDSEVRAGLEVMQEQFDETGGVLYVMHATDGDFAYNLAEIPGVEAVTSRFEGDYTLYALDLSETDGVLEAVEALLQEVTHHLSGSLEGVDPVPDNMMLLIAVPAVIILALILFAMCASWFEPVIFFINIGIAVLINLGTNVIFEHVSDVTMMIAALLQVVLSMDYAIIFLNRFRMEKGLAADPRTAMRNTIENSFSVISGIAFTTIVGMLMLVFMSFRIGADIGLVIAKGVFVSLICVFAVMPALILKFEGLIERTAKPVLTLKMDKVGSFSHKFRYGMLIIFLMLFGAATYLQRGIVITYSETGADPVHHVFDLDNPFMILYENADEALVSQLMASIEQKDLVIQIDAYSTTVGAPLTASEMADALELEPEWVGFIYRNHFGTLTTAVQLGTFLEFLQTDVATNPEFGQALDAETLGQLEMMAAMIEPEVLDSFMNAQELADFLQMDLLMVQPLFDFYDFIHGESPTETLTLIDFLTYLVEDFSQHPMFPEEMLPELEASMDDLAEARALLVGPDFSRALIQTALPVETDETFLFIDGLLEQLDELPGRSYLLGASAMPHEMAQSFPAELSFITLLTAVAFFFVTALSFKSIPVAIILVVVIQGAVYVTLGTIYFMDEGIMYLALIIAQVLLKSRVIDYGILYTANYIEARKIHEPKNAIIQALETSMPTILTSGLIIVLVTFVTGLVFRDINGAIASILLLISQGCLIGTLLSVYVLPSLIAIFDKWVTRAKAQSH